MAFDYQGMRATADDLIGDAGQAVTLLRQGAATGDSFDPTFGEDTSFAATAVVTRYRGAQIDGTRIQAGDLRVVVAAGSIDVQPTPADRIVIAGLTYRVLDVEAVAPGGTTVVYRLQARR